MTYDSTQDNFLQFEMVWRAEKPDFGFERSDLESKRPDLGSERLFLRLGGDGRKLKKITLCGIIGHRPLRGRCPKTTVIQKCDGKT